jgi:hypothetical protein
MSHLDICNTSYGRKKGRESNWQFDSRPLKVGNRLGPGVCRWSATRRWKALEESYKFVSNLISIGGRGEPSTPSSAKCWEHAFKSPHFRILETKAHPWAWLETWERVSGLLLTIIYECLIFFCKCIYIGR